MLIRRSIYAQMKIYSFELDFAAWSIGISSNHLAASKFKEFDSTQLRIAQCHTFLALF
jgi:hypothetical protein